MTGGEQGAARLPRLSFIGDGSDIFSLKNSEETVYPSSVFPAFPEKPTILTRRCGVTDSVAIQLKHVTKRFGSIVANKDVDLDVLHGEILAVLGENGSGKTTLMNMISGIYYPDEGEVYVDGEPVVIRSPKDAFRYKIGMIHQHFKLVDVFTATENIILGINEDKYSLPAARE